MEPASKRELNLRVAVPAEVDDGSLRGEQLKRALEPSGRGAGVHNQVATAGGLTRQREVDTKCRRNLGPTCVDVDERDVCPRESSQQACHAAAHHTGADNGHPVAEQRLGVPQGVDRGFDGPGKHGTRSRHALRHNRHGARRHHVGGLVRKQTEDGSAAQFRRSVLHRADVEVAVLDRRRELSLLKRRPHRGVLACRHTAAEHQRLSAATDARPQGAHQHVVRPGFREGDRTDLPFTRRAQPKRARFNPHLPHLLAVEASAKRLPPPKKQTPARRLPTSHRGRCGASRVWCACVAS